VLGVTLLAPQQAWADCDLAAEERAIEGLLASEETAAAVERAEGLGDRCAGEPSAARLQARVYVLAGNLMAAGLTLQQALTDHPGDCATRAWRAWVHLAQGESGLAAARLAEDGCPPPGRETARWRVLRALVAERGGDTRQARQLLAGIGERQVLYPEDEVAFGGLRRRHLPDLEAPVTLQADLGLGLTSNPFAASPTDQAARDGAASPIARPAGRLYVRAPLASVTPAAELSLRTHGIATDAARELSYALSSLRAGAWWGAGRVRPFVGLRHEELLLEMPGQRRYAWANRAEIDLTLPANATVLTGFGRRVFPHDDWRTRWEWDGALVLVRRVMGRPALLAGAVRVSRARRAVHDRRGGTITASLGTPLPRGLSARVVVACALDGFPRSGGADGLTAFGIEDRRRDVLAHVLAIVRKPLGRRASLFGGYELARRWSTADGPALPFPYVDQRFLIGVRVEEGFNPWRRRAPSEDDHVRLPYAGMGLAERGDWEDVRALLGQEEDLAGDCGCTVP